MRIKHILLVVLMAFAALGASAEIIRVSIFSQSKIKTLVFTTDEGKYSLVADNRLLMRLKKNTIIYFTIVGKGISVWDQDEHLGIFSELYLTASTRKSIFKVEPAVPALKARLYDGDLKVTTDGGNLKIENYVDVNDYLSGVVESEAGPKAPYEYYKTQAIISRTYLYEKIWREGVEKYNLMDDVSHQVYLNRCHRNSLIRQAVAHTTDLIIVDSTNTPITAVFHSNSGGQTANSEDVWLSSLPYLKSVIDTFSIRQHNSVWRDTVSIDRWIKYLKNNGIKINDSKSRTDNLVYSPTSRDRCYRYLTDTIPLKKIRADFGFKSAWFSIKPKPDGRMLEFTGYGYGHGVGLSQEGAMEMARRNYSFLDIINFYYQGVRVVNIRNIEK
ncbi:MAG: SpoIID/LytB domain-containing protein [Salinivirgaceae bacterium]|nr:SpoIID/LytB domain-containing protein [Salinivirgaceae bacterium]